jgi:hypothetical protein
MRLKAAALRFSDRTIGSGTEPWKVSVDMKHGNLKERFGQ